MKEWKRLLKFCLLIKIFNKQVLRMFVENLERQRIEVVMLLRISCLFIIW